MLHQDTLISTDFGVFKAGNILSGCSVPTTEGWCKINSQYGYKVYNRKYRIETEIGVAIVDEHQHFFSDSKRINVLRLHSGMMIDTFYGPRKILKMNQIVNKDKYMTIKVYNFNNNFYIHNGILVSC